MLSNWDHSTSSEYQKTMEDSRLGLTCSDSIFINGHGAVYCPGAEKISSVELPYLITLIDNNPLPDKGSLGRLPPAFEGKIPAGLNSGCTPTIGSHVTIEVDPTAGYVEPQLAESVSSYSGDTL
ncbi:Multicopper oxidase type 2 [Penicillium coprophilum]|uniref:Multicopper oxidase type 2 n=1 Tax=Penicillium coprophilum TaxID=36646 RepID=UPI002381F2CC|nr:Multicopper oxidase type 2 [Penicillium coprophilum]KAJ5165527.1 Multicopper oxidase type 2 [Penicillium coprophilum]